MPISPKFTWKENQSHVTLRVSIKGLHQSNIHLFCSSALLKLNSPPYLLLIDLFDNVDEARSSAVRSQDEFVVTLAKKQVGLWGRLTAEGEKSTIAQRRNASIQEFQEKVVKAAEEKKERKQKGLKAASEKQFELEREKRREIEARKQKELTQEREEVAKWEKKHNQHNSFELKDQDKEKIVEVCKIEQVEDLQDGAENEQKELEVHQKEIGSGSNVWVESELDQASTQEWSIEFQPVRCPAEAVPVYFTKLETPNLPAREKREEELKLYKKYVADNGADGEDLKIGERLPAFLKDKGDSLYAQGNYRGAINAYNRAIEMDPRQIMCVANRSACYLKLGDHRACIADCSSALKELMLEDENRRLDPPKLLKFRACLAKLFGRRGISRSLVDDLEEAALDFEQAIKYNPDDEQLKENLAEVKVSLGPQSVETVMKQGLSRFSRGNYLGAKESFTSILKSGNLSKRKQSKVYANRAACYLALEEYEAAVQDCDKAISLVCNCSDLAHVENEILSKSFEELKCGFEENTLIEELCRLFCRKGAILSYEKNYEVAIKQYECAKLLDHACTDSNKEMIEKDMSRIQSLMLPEARA